MAKEFWLHKRAHELIWRGWERPIDMRNKNTYHVIEKSAANKLAEALEKLHSIFVENGDFDLGEICIAALKEYRGEE